MRKVSSSAYYNEYHGHRPLDLEIVHSHLRGENNRSLVFLAGDSSLDNKFWFKDEAVAINGYESVLEPPSSKQDIAYWMNKEIVKQNISNRLAVINCAIEESTIGGRSCGHLLPQDIFIRDHIRGDDILIVSVGGNDIALAPTPCTIVNVASVVFCTSTTCLKDAACGTSIPVDDCFTGCICGFTSNFLAFPFGLGYLIHLFRTRVEAIIRGLTATKRPKLVLVCMIYFLDEQSGRSWADGVLRVLGYDRNPNHLQEVIRQIFRLATQSIHIDGTRIVPVPLFEVLDGKNTNDYCQRVEPSAAGGEKMGTYLIRKLQDSIC